MAFLKHFRVRLVGVYEHARSRVGRVAWTDGLGHFVASYDLCCRRHAHAWHKVAIHSAFPFFTHIRVCDPRTRFIMAEGTPEFNAFLSLAPFEVPPPLPLPTVLWTEPGVCGEVAERGSRSGVSRCQSFYISHQRRRRFVVCWLAFGRESL